MTADFTRADLGPRAVGTHGAGYFPDYILDPSVIAPNDQASSGDDYHTV